MDRAITKFALCLCMALGAAALAAAAAENDEIVFGTSLALTGPAAELGVNMRAGIQAALFEANRAGGVHGHHLRLLALDDSYEPAKTVPNMRQLVADERVVAIVGNVGTPTAVAALPIAIEGHIPFYGAFTGAGVLRRTPPDHYVINYRASYAEETAAMVDVLIASAGLRPSDIAFFTQRDAYGDAGFAGGMAALRRHGLADGQQRVAHVRYERNTLAVEKALADLLLMKHAPRAVILVGAYAPCARFIRLARQHGLDAIYLNVSFVGAEPLARELGSADGEGVIITQTVPHYDADLPIARDYRSALHHLDDAAAPTFGSMEGYVSTRLLITALRKRKTDAAPTRQDVVSALESLGRVDLGLGVELSLTPTQHQASHGVWPTIIRGGKVVPLRWKELAATAAADGGPAHE
jgi:ABC-type branched-subunit amino acid transport system substrate-binding protein